METGSNPTKRTLPDLWRQGYEKRSPEQLAKDVINLGDKLYALELETVKQLRNLWIGVTVVGVIGLGAMLISMLDKS